VPPVLKIDHTQAQHEAKAKIFWGDPPEEVIKFLMIRGFSYQEASDKVRVLFNERLAAIRTNGIGKILMGIFIAFGSAASFLLLVRAGLISLWLLASAGIACVSGLWMILVGIFKVLAPKSERGDASDND
jgi:predicted phage tail protein